MASPTILLVSGFWEDPETYAECRSLLKKSGYETTAIGLSSRGHVSPGNPSMDDDIAAIRTPVQKLVESSKEVILVLHSAAGFLGSAAIESLNASARKAQGLAGVLQRLFFLPQELRRRVRTWRIHLLQRSRYVHGFWQREPTVGGVAESVILLSGSCSCRGSYNSPLACSNYLSLLSQSPCDTRPLNLNKRSERRAKAYALEGLE